MTQSKETIQVQNNLSDKFDSENNLLSKNNSSELSDSGDSCLSSSTESELNMANNINLKSITKSIPEYDGNNLKLDLHKFLKCADLVFNNLSPENKNQFAEVLKIRLSGEAYQHVKYQNFDSYEELKNSLNFQFGIKKSTAQIRLEFTKVYQKKEEDVRSYANRVQRLLHELNDASVVEEGVEAARILLNSNSNLAKVFFQEGLRQSLKNIIKGYRFETLQEAIVQACQEETLQTLTNTVRNESFNSIKCKICGKLNHTAKNCFQLNSKNQNNSSINTINVFCKYCKKKGHEISDCRKLKSKQSKIESDPKPSTSSQASGSVSSDSKNMNGLETMSATTRVQDL